MLHVAARPKLRVLGFGLIPYRDGLELQRDCHRKRCLGELPDTLVLLEHPPVITRGLRAGAAEILAAPEELSARGIEVVDVERGGEATYHGPGQLVGYPIVDLRGVVGGIRAFVYGLEEVLINALWSAYRIRAGRDGEHRGVWVGDEKIAALGIAVSRQVSFHGFALNVDIDLANFALIVPCGIRDRGLTSVERILGRKVGLNTAAAAVEAAFRRHFGYTEAID